MQLDNNIMFLSNIIIPVAFHTRFHAGVRRSKRSGIRVEDRRIDAGRSALGNRRVRGRSHWRGHCGSVSGRCHLTTRSSVQPVRHVLDADRRQDRCQGKCVAQWRAYFKPKAKYLNNHLPTTRLYYIIYS